MSHSFRLLIAFISIVLPIPGGSLIPGMPGQPAYAQTSPVEAEPQRPSVPAQRPRVQAPTAQVRPMLAEEGGEVVAGTDCFSGVVDSLRIGADGEIRELVLSSRSNTAKPRIRGCGVRIAEIPFLWDLYLNKDLIAEFCYRDGCLNAVNLIY